jgi:uncharacterized protein with HEPN domain
MSDHDDWVSLRHMLDHAREACGMVQGRNRSDLPTDRSLELSLTRLIEIIGEAATRVSDSTKEKHGEIPWKNIVGMRNRLIHGYDRVDLDVLWDTVEINLPPLIRHLQKIVGEQR